MRSRRFFAALVFFLTSIYTTLGGATPESATPAAVPAEEESRAPSTEATPTPAQEAEDVPAPAAAEQAAPTPEAEVAPESVEEAAPATEAEAAPESEEEVAPASTTESDTEEEPEPCPERCGPGESVTGLFGNLRLGLGIWDSAALEVQVQGGWAFRSLMVGIVLEYNPFLEFSKPDISAGCFGFGAFLTWRYRLNRRVSLRLEALVGGSVLLFETYGYHTGDVGLWLGMKVLGLDIDLHRNVALTIDVVDISLPVFHITEMPFIYPQWRWAVGVTFR